jgi:hypothetical protein
MLTIKVIDLDLVPMQVTTEQYISVPWSFIQSSGGGSYIITLSRARARLVYTLEVGGGRFRVQGLGSEMRVLQGSGFKAWGLGCVCWGGGARVHAWCGRWV